MSTKKPIKWKEIDLSKLKIGLCKKTPKLYYEETDSEGNVNLNDLQIQFPHMFLPFGLKENETKSQWSNFKEYYFDCSLKNDSEEVSFNKFLNELNSRIVFLINEFNSFKEPCNENNYSKIEKIGKFKSLIKFNIQRDKEGTFNSYVFKYNNAKKHDKILLKDENISNVIKQRTVFIPTVNCSKIYFYKDKYGSIWNIVQMLIIEKENDTNNSNGSNGSNGNNVNNVYNMYGFA